MAFSKRFSEAEKAFRFTLNSQLNQPKFNWNLGARWTGHLKK